MELGMGNHLNGNYLHFHGNLFQYVLCCGKLIEGHLPDACAFCAEFADY